MHLWHLIHDYFHFFMITHFFKIEEFGDDLTGKYIHTFGKILRLINEEDIWEKPSKLNLALLASLGPVSHVSHVLSTATAPCHLMIQEGSLEIFVFSGPSRASPWVLLPTPRYLKRWGSGLFPHQPPTGSHFRPREHTHLLLTSMRPSRWTAKSCSLCTCFSSSERPYRKWSSPEGTQVTGEAGRDSRRQLTVPQTLLPGG